MNSPQEKFYEGIYAALDHLRDKISFNDALTARDNLMRLFEACADQAAQPPLCAACEVRHWPMQNTLCPETEKTWAAVYKARGFKLAPIEPNTQMAFAGAAEMRGLDPHGKNTFDSGDAGKAAHIYKAMLERAPKNAG